MVVFWIHKHRATARQMQPHSYTFILRLQPKSLRVEFLSSCQVVNRETAECRSCFEHRCSPCCDNSSPACWPDRVCRGPRLSIQRCVHHTEEVALGVLEDDEVLPWLRGLGMAGRSQLEQPSHFFLLVVRVEIEVQSVVAHSLLRNELQRHVDVRSLWIP